MNAVVAGLVLVAVSVALVALEPEPGRRSVRLRRIGVGIGSVASGLVGLFVVGETVADPGGWAAVGLVASWAVPVAVVGALAWLRPAAAVPVLTGAVVAVVVLNGWYALDPQGWGRFEDGNGPVRMLATVATGAVLTIAGARRPLQAGVLLVVLGLVPPLLTATEHGLRGSSVLAGLVPTVTGAYLLAAEALGAARRRRTVFS